MVSTITFLTCLLVGLGGFTTLVGANPTPSLTKRDSNPQGISLRSIGAHHHRSFEPRTNAERLRRGLTLLPPKRRAGGSRLQARQSATPCETVTGVIGVTYTDSVPAVHNGYITAAANSFGEYGFVEDKNAALHVSFCSSDNGPFEFLPLNGVAGYSSLGAVQGFAASDSNLVPGSSNYAYLVASSHVDAGPAVTGLNAFSQAAGVPEPLETTIWVLGANGVLTAAWVNTNNDVASTTIIYVPSAAAFAITGDISAFNANFGTSFEATFTFVADP